MAGSAFAQESPELVDPASEIPSANVEELPASKSTEANIVEQPSDDGDTAATDMDMEAVDQDIAEKGDLSFWRRSAGWMELSRDNLSSGIERMARGIDRFFAGDEALDDDNKSFARLRFSGTFEEGESVTDNTELKFRLSLPATQRKLRLVIENDPDDDETLEDKNRPSSSDENSTDESTFTAALQVVNSEMSKWKSKGELGVRASTPVNPFVRHTATRRWSLDENWSAKFRQRIAYYKNDGYRANETLNFERRISDDWFFRIKSELEWRETRDSMDAAQVFSFFNRIDDARGVRYSWGTLASSLHHTVIDKSYLAIDYRQLLYKDWLYLNVIPEVEFPRRDDYDSVSSITVRLEVLFFE
ncbi:MAG: hypothetical protein MI867_29660 [Pseudomonadales bacterium]|nr:hypothetical protein [Pseudomonadales bacterium]